MKSEGTLIERLRKHKDWKKLPKTPAQAASFLEKHSVEELVDLYIKIFYQSKDASEFSTVAVDSFESMYGNSVYSKAEEYLSSRLEKFYPIGTDKSLERFKVLLNEYTIVHLGEGYRITDVTEKSGLSYSTVSEIYSFNIFKIPTFERVVCIALALHFTLQEVNELLYLLNRPLINHSSRDMRKEIIFEGFMAGKELDDVDDELNHNYLPSLSGFEKGSRKPIDFE